MPLNLRSGTTIPIVVYEDDDVQTMANKIFNYFEVNQSCKVTGFIMNEQWRRLEPKGELVCDEIERLDKLENCIVGEVIRRKNKKFPNSIGGYKSQKAFCWKKVIVDDEIKYTIWRVQ
jgi:hypothetical protein